jgi:hypothetical protein
MPQALEASWWWVHYQREGMRAAARLPVVRDGETHWFSEWELMVRAMARRDRRLQEQTLNPGDLDDRVRALLLPRNFTSTGGELTKQDDEWDTREWKAYGELSRAVADVLNAPDGEHRLRAALGGSPPSPAVHRTPERTVLIPRWRPYLRQPWLFVRWIYSLGSRLERSRLPVLASAGGWIADRDRRVAYHTRLHALAALLDCKINEARSPEKVLELVRSA